MKKDDNKDPERIDPANLWQLLREHAAWLNHEKQIIWRRFASSLTAVSIYFAGSTIAIDRIPAAATIAFSALGMIICVLWFFQTTYGWRLLNRRLEIVAQIQGEIESSRIEKWPLAFRPGKEQKHDWIKILALSMVLVFFTSFLIVGAVNVYKGETRNSKQSEIQVGG